MERNLTGMKMMQLKERNLQIMQDPDEPSDNDTKVVMTVSPKMRMIEIENLRES